MYQAPQVSGVDFATVLCKDETENQVRQVQLLREMRCLDCVIRGEGFFCR